MIDIYFFRHGETNGNAVGRHQPDVTRLTARGEEQAKTAGVLALELKPTHFLVSTQVRAVETARLMGKSLTLIPETNELFQELVRPKSINGYYHWSFKTVWYLIRWYFELADGNNGSSEGESYRTFRRRLKETKQYLVTFPPGSRVVVVSHAVFINLFMAHLCHENRLPWWRAMRYFIKIFTLRNTGVIHVRFAPELVNKECPWRVLKEL